MGAFLPEVVSVVEVTKIVIDGAKVLGKSPLVIGDAPQRADGLYDGRMGLVEPFHKRMIFCSVVAWYVSPTI